MNSSEETTGARIVCVHSFDTRSVSRRASHASPVAPVHDSSIAFTYTSARVSPP